MDIMDIADEIMKANDQPPLNITDLCDLVLIKICSYLDLYDKCLIMPQVCRRFATISSLCLPKEIDSQELKEQKWNERNTSTLFRKIGSSLRTFKIDYNHANPNYLDFMLMEIRGKYLNIENLLIKEAVKECHVTNLPKMIRKISVYTFLGNLLDLRYLYSLETLHLGVEDVPSALNWVKVGSRLKELQLSLNCEKISNNFSKIDGLLSSISDNYSVHVDLHSDIYAELQDINFGPLKDVWNVETFDISGYRTDTEDINNMLQVLAERNTIKKINIGWILCNASPVITLKTVDSLLRCSSLERIDFTSNCYIYSMMSVFIKRLRLKNIRMLYGKNTTYSADLTIEKLIKLVALKRDNADDYTNDYLHFNPMDRTLRFTLTVEDEGLRHTFSLMFLQCAPQLHWTRDYNPYVRITAIS